MSLHSDVLIAGAGPAGCVAACLLRQYGHSVRILEQSTFPRFVIGESLLPQMMAVLGDAGLLEDLQHRAYQLKNGAVFHRDGMFSSIAFAEKWTPGPSETWEVPRSDFDQTLAAATAARGVDIHFSACVLDLHCSERACQVTARHADGSTHRYNADFVLDATGGSQLLAQQLGLAQKRAQAPRQAVFCHLDDHIGDSAYDRDKILIPVHPRDHEVWYWLIPFADGRSSIGVTAPIDYFQRFGDLDASEILRTLITEEPLLNRLLHNAVYDRQVHDTSHYSSCLQRLHAPGCAVIGNAAGFIDPVFSSGLTLAMQSARLAAALVDRCLRGENPDWHSDYEKLMRSGSAVFEAFINAWYSGDLQDILFHPQSNKAIRQQIAAILAGYAWDTSNPFTQQPQRRLQRLASFCRRSLQES